MRRRLGRLIVVVFALLAGARPFAAGIAFVNASGTFTAGAGTSVATPATSLTTGNFEVCGVRFGASAISGLVLSRVTSMTDTAGNLYQAGAGPTTGAASMLEVWYASNVTGNASNVVTAHFASVAATSIVCAQFSGISTGSPVDVWALSAYGGGTSATPTTAAFTTTVANEVIVIFGQQEQTAHPWSGSSGYTLGGQDASDVVGVAYKIVSTTQSAVTASITSTDSAQSKCAIAVTLTAPQTGGGETSAVISGGS